jgi:small subunit ribosomal protein S17
MIEKDSLSLNLDNSSQETAKTDKTRSRIFQGQVVGNNRQKTISVLVGKRKKHQLVGKVVGSSKKYHVHVESEKYNLGDIVEISEGRPSSKSKTWIVSRLVQSALQNVSSVG